MSIEKLMGFRITEELHRQAKMQAARENKSIQNWMRDLILSKLSEKKIHCRTICQGCGGWELKGTRLAVMGNCEECGATEVLVLPCWEKK